MTSALLRRTWREIAALPLQQRQALLLQAQIDEGDSIAHLLIDGHVANMREIVALTDGATSEALWHRLPLRDLEVAALLGKTRQQVINLRKSARERLRRRAEKAGLPLVI
jgi:hypothetical protein